MRSILMTALILATVPASAEDTRTADLEALAGMVGDAIEVVTTEDGTLIATPEGASFRIAAVEPPGRLSVALEGIQVELGPRVKLGLGCLDLLEPLAVMLVDADGGATTARLEVTALAGCSLRTGNAIVTGDGVYRRIEAEPAAPADLRSRWEQLAVALDERIAASHMNSTAQRLTTKAIHAAGDPGDGAELGELSPDFLRQLVAHGWLSHLLGDTPLTEEAAGLARAMRAPGDPRVYERAGVARWIEWQDATGRHSATMEMLDDSGAVAEVIAARQLPSPAYYTLTDPLWLVTTHGPDSDPTAWPRAARVLEPGGKTIAWWDEESGFHSANRSWRRVFTPRKQVLQGELPPHIPVLDRSGDLLGLITAHGTVRPPQDGSREEAERFLDEAAAALPDAGHVDLVGEYLMRYTFDSPDPEHPLVVGTPELNGDIHQSAFDTLSTTAGGICRGDCDDLAEVYQQITRRQGKLSHIMSIPAHNALCWAEQDEEERWHVYVLQTGPALETIARTLPDALEKAYGHFMGGAPFDPDGLGISLRFSNENQRGDWYLGWRIFRDADYASTMIDVQRDWHFKTYHRGMVKMRRLLDEGDRDPANYKELAGLARATGQWRLTARYHQAALAAYGDPLLTTQLSILRALLMAGEIEPARELAHELIEDELPRLVETHGEPAIEVMMSVAATLLGMNGQPELAAEILGGFLGQSLHQSIRNVLRWMASSDFSVEAWQNAPAAMRLRGNLRNYSSLVAMLFQEVVEGGVAEVDPDAVQRMRETVELYFQQLAFLHPDGDSDVLVGYGLLGDYRLALEGRETFLEKLAQAGMPEAPIDHAAVARESVLGDAQLGWIKASVPFWAGVAGWYLRDEVETLDREGFEAACRSLVEARDATARLGQDHVVLDIATAQIELVRALVTGDLESLRATVRDIARHADKTQTDAAVESIGGAARFVDLEGFRAALDIWAEEVDTKPSWFGIAWAAALQGAHEHALMAARMGVERFPDETAFAEELQYMEQLFEEPPGSQDDVEIPAPVPPDDGESQPNQDR